MATCTIENRSQNPFIIYYTGGKKSKLTLYAGINLGVDEQEWSAASKHPSVKIAIEEGTLHKLTKSPEPEGEYKGVEVYTDKKSRDEPTPLVEAKSEGDPIKQTQSRRRGRPKSKASTTKSTNKTS